MQVPDDAQAHKEASVEIAARPEAVYDLVSDLTRMGEWSPEATGGEWRDGGRGQVGDWFIGHNKAGDREWSREAQVAVADRGREFTFVVGGVEANCTWWCYEMQPSATGTRLTEKWWFVNKTPGLATATEEQLRTRIEATQGALEATIAAVKATAEAG
ncbi:MAG: SRPBCC family protein [Acidimicrobiales bacterium]